jgi:hypothetical protein
VKDLYSQSLSCWNLSSADISRFEPHSNATTIIIPWMTCLGTLVALSVRTPEIIVLESYLHSTSRTCFTPVEVPMTFSDYTGNQDAFRQHPSTASLQIRSHHQRRISDF